MSSIHPHRFATEFVKSRFLSDATATIDLLLMLIVEENSAVNLDRLQHLSLLGRPQIKETIQKLAADGNLVASSESGHETYEITLRGRARARYLLVDYFHELRRMEALLVEELATRFRKLADRGVRSVALYPVGETAEIAAHALGAAGIALKMAVDDAPALWGQDFHGVIISPPEELVGAHIDAVILATCVFQEQLRAQLKLLNVAAQVIDF